MRLSSIHHRKFNAADDDYRKSLRQPELKRFGLIVLFCFIALFAVHSVLTPNGEITDADGETVMRSEGRL